MIRVVSALIVREGRLFLQQRSGGRDYPMTWEGPGGKVEAGESDVQALYRELCEEVGWESAAQNTIEYPPLFKTVFEPPDAGVKTAFEITFYKAVPYPLWVPQLIDAAGMGWFTLDETKSLKLAPGNARYFPQFLEKGALP